MELVVILLLFSNYFGEKCLLYASSAYSKTFAMESPLSLIKSFVVNTANNVATKSLMPPLIGSQRQRDIEQYFNIRDDWMEKWSPSDEKFGCRYCLEVLTESYFVHRGFRFNQKSQYACNVALWARVYITDENGAIYPKKEAIRVTVCPYVKTIKANDTLESGLFYVTPADYDNIFALKDVTNVDYPKLAPARKVQDIENVYHDNERSSDNLLNLTLFAYVETKSILK